ncbi:MAG: hypothetical protein IJ420_07925 [Lachnospiraceae bacterium]|nr:hypothetical protein [Lachnospiraceae bacterium]
MLFDIFSGFEGAQYTIEGASYTADELKEKQEEFTPQNAKKQLIELIKEREKQERECGSKTPILFQDRDDRAVFIKNYTDGMTGLVVGNAFLIALSMQEYGLARELAGRVRMEDGSFCYFDENSPVNWTGLSIKTVNLLEVILKKGRLPEDIRVFLLESMIKQSKASIFFMKDKKERFTVRVRMYLMILLIAN